jgi:hypothetical protein
MASLVPTVPVMLDTERQLKIDMEVVSDTEIELGRIYGHKVHLLQMLFDPVNLSITDVGILLWCGLRKQDPSLTRHEVFACLSLEHLPVVMTAIYEAWNLANQHAQQAIVGASAPPFVPPSPGSASGVLAGSASASVTASSGI